MACPFSWSPHQVLSSGSVGCCSKIMLSLSGHHSEITQRAPSLPIAIEWAQLAISRQISWLKLHAELILNSLIVDLINPFEPVNHDWDQPSTPIEVNKSRGSKVVLPIAIHHPTAGCGVCQQYLGGHVWPRVVSGAAPATGPRWWKHNMRIVKDKVDWHTQRSKRESRSQPSRGCHQSIQNKWR